MIVMFISREIKMSKWSLLLLFMSSTCNASQVIYLTCNGVATDTGLNKVVSTMKSDFIINKKEKYIQQVITGMTEEQTKNLRYPYTETPTQYVSHGFSINRHTLDYAVEGVMGVKITGSCKLMAPAI